MALGRIIAGRIHEECRQGIGNSQPTSHARTVERKPLAGNEQDSIPISWNDLKDDADNERGLFKIVVLYVDDKIKGCQRRSLRDYIEADESRRFEAGLDLATLIFDALVTAPLASLVGLPTIAVGITLVGIQWGYRKLTDTNVDRVGDQSA